MSNPLNRFKLNLVIANRLLAAIDPTEEPFFIQEPPKRNNITKA